MIQSMTWYGFHETDGIRVEVRSRNHRFLEVGVSSKDYILSLKQDMEFRQAIKSNFSRGRFDVSVNIWQESMCGGVKVNKHFVDMITDVLNKLKKDYKLDGKVSIDTLMNYKENIFIEKQCIKENVLTEVFDKALSKLGKMRIKEWKFLIKEINIYVHSLENIIKEVIHLENQHSNSRIDKVYNKLKDILNDHEIDEARILQEVWFIAKKLDISEEITRFESHVKQLKENIKTDVQIWRKLDFIIQELNREANTISAKTDEYVISALVVEAKSLLEKLREQVQNFQ